MQRSIGLSSVLVMLALSLTEPEAAQARWYNPGYYGYGYGRGGYRRRGGLGYGYGGYGGGTVAGSYLRGMSQVIRAQGQYNAATARAAISYEDARSRYIDNRKKWTDTYYALREQSEAHQAAKLASERHSPEILAQAAHSALPRPLSSDALDPATGKITWPESLQNSLFAGPRAELDHLFEPHASTGGASRSPEIRTTISQMVEILKSNIHNLPAGEYISDRKFLDSLEVSGSS